MADKRPWHLIFINIYLMLYPAHHRQAVYLFYLFKFSFYG